MKFPALGALTLNKLGSVAGRLSKVYKIIDTQSFAFAFELKSKRGDIITLSRCRVEYKNMFHITHVLPWVKPQCIPTRIARKRQCGICNGKTDNPSFYYIILGRPCLPFYLIFQINYTFPGVSHAGAALLA